MDYSKWDHIDVSDDEEDDYLPNVSKLDDNSKVEIGPQGVKLLDSNNNGTKDIIKSSNNAIPSSSSSSSNLMTRNGAKLEKFNWSQSRSDVTLYIAIGDTLSKSLSVKLTEGKTLEIIDKSNTQTILKETFKYEIDTRNDFLDESFNIIDWEVKVFNNQRYIVIYFQKKSPISNASFWWDQVFLSDDITIDVASIPDRKMPSNELNQSFNSVWEQAHKMFREKIQATNESSKESSS